MTLAEFAKGSTTFLVVIAAGFVSTAYVDRQYARRAPLEAPSASTTACIGEDGGWKNWPWSNVPTLSPKCGRDR